MVYAPLKALPARPDGRPQYYDLSKDDAVMCWHCLQNGLQSQYGRGQAVLADPANPPAGPDEKGAVYTVCIPHLPEDAVIFDPKDGLCRDKSGQNSWREKDA